MGTKLKSVKLTIESCTECPHHRTSRDYTSDSFEYCEKWSCTKSGADVRRYVDCFDKTKFIPVSCPLAKKAKV